MRKKLIDLRKSKCLTQDEVSKILEISRSTYNGYELGTIDPPLETALKIKKLFKYTKDDIFLKQNDRIAVKEVK